MKLISLQIKTTTNFKKNLNHLITLIDKCEDNSFILAPEVCLTNFCYDKMQEASQFSKIAIKKIKKISAKKTIGLTLITKKQNLFYNTFYLFKDNKIIHKQAKVKLFPLGDELKYFKEGKKERIKIFEIDGLKIAVLICFEIRFPKLWNKVKGADIILNPAMWGLKRKDHYETISKSLALINQCFVIACNSANDNMAKGSAIISPFGEVVKNDNEEIIECEVDLAEIKRVRKYINIGLDDA